MHVELLARNGEVLLRRHRHHCESLVDLEEIDVLGLPAGLGQELCGSPESARS